ncbi:hypothetical protein Hypma_014579 [Hypsizygus marmoreus]|uniref:Uncharacterized protein n=1 Tax=Hypsizygus marmoreus TaxID=39966 RepID=A0A369J9W1_HYPMA|nr:hypothetical protein Hypma_014579 [Hypsizygus marmoreus]
MIIGAGDYSANDDIGSTGSRAPNAPQLTCPLLGRHSSLNPPGTHEATLVPLNLSPTFSPWTPQLANAPPIGRFEPQEHLHNFSTQPPERPSFLLLHPTHAARLARARVSHVDRHETQPARSVTLCHAGAPCWLSEVVISDCTGYLSLHWRRAVLTGRYDDGGGEWAFRRKFIAAALALIIPQCDSALGLVRTSMMATQHISCVHLASSSLSILIVLDSLCPTVPPPNTFPNSDIPRLWPAPPCLSSPSFPLNTKDDDLLTRWLRLTRPAPVK